MGTILFARGLSARPPGALAQDAASAAEGVWNVVGTTWTAGYRVAPALMLGLLALIAVPMTALFASAARWWRRRRVQPSTHSALPEVPSPQHRQAFLELLDERGRRVALDHDMVRIGREYDNDIRILSKKVHRYHAAIHREDFGIYRITDLAGAGGNGVSVNGALCTEAELKDGDLIELGPGRLRFHAGLV